MGTGIAVAIIVPVYSGETYLRELAGDVAALKQLWMTSGSPLTVSELIFVDDGAVDGSAAVIDALAQEHAWITAMHLSRNYGQHAATVAGIRRSTAEWVVTMDEDLQHPPKNIPLLLDQVARTHCDIVYAKPTEGVHESASRDFTSRSYKRIVEWLTGTPGIRKASSFRLIRGPIARRAAEACAHETYLDIALSWFSTRIEVISMPLKDTRFIQTGRSGYRFRSLISHARRMLISSQIKVLRLVALFGLLAVALSALAGVAIIAAKLINPAFIEVRGWTSMMATIVFFGGMILLTLGIVIEYLSLLVVRAHGRPMYFEVDRRSDALLPRP